MAVKKIKTEKKDKKTKRQTKSVPAFSKPSQTSVKPNTYIEAVGRRKTSTARVRIFSGAGEIKINGKTFREYFPTEEMQKIVASPFKKANLGESFSVNAKVYGGGIHSQSEAVRHGISRALVAHDIELRKRLKKFGFLKRDPRMKERRKFGLKKARKAPQWAKR